MLINLFLCCGGAGCGAAAGPRVSSGSARGAAADTDCQDRGTDSEPVLISMPILYCRSSIKKYLLSYIHVMLIYKKIDIFGIFCLQEVQRRQADTSSATPALPPVPVLVK